MVCYRIFIKGGVILLYAVVDENNICISIKSISGTKDNPDHIELEIMDTDLLGRKYENGVWGEKIQSPANLTPSLEDRIKATEEAINLLLGL